MKKKITILILMLISIVNIALGANCGSKIHAYYDGSGNKTQATKWLNQSGTITNVELIPSSDTASITGQVKFVVKVTFKDYETYFRESGVVGYFAQFGKYDITLNFYCNNVLKGTEIYTYTKSTASRVDGSFKKSGAALNIKEFTADSPTYTFYLPLNENIDKTSYSWYVKATVKPSNVESLSNVVSGCHFEWAWGIYDECGIYSYATSSTGDSSNKTITITYSKPSHNITSSYHNQKVNINGTPYHMIYNDSNAKIGMSLNHSDIPQVITINNSTHQTYSAFIKNINNGTYSAFSSESIKSLVNITPSNDIFYTKERTLSEFGSVTAGSKINIQHTLIYSKSTPTTGQTTQDNLHIRSENTLNYIVVPTVKFPAFTTEEKKTIYKYYSKGIKENINYLIGLKNKTIQTTSNQGIDIQAYNPDYKWLYSYDENNWSEIPTDYLISENTSIDGINKGEKIISSKILGDKDVCYIKQKAILKSFSDSKQSNLYSEKIDDKYYISITSDYYTIKKIPTITSDNIKLTGNIRSDLNTQYYPQSNYNGKTIKFDLEHDPLNDELIEAINKTATYSLSVKKNGISENILNYNKDSGYYISGYKYGEWVFTCKITLGNGEVITKDITLNSYPEAYFNQLTNEEKKAVYKCYTKENKVTSKNEVISLKNKEVKLNNQYLDLSLCLPEYYWEYSYDNTNWIKLDDKYKADISNIALTAGDINISSAIFTENGKNVYFRQRAILKAFVSTDKKEQFTEYFESNGKKGYYIATTSGTYTFKKIPTPQDVNFSFVKDDNNISTDSKVCFLESADFYNGKKIELEFVKDANLSDDEFAALKNMALYKIYSKEELKDIELNHPYTISGYENGQSITYLCKIIFGETVSLEKEITISSYPEEKININKIEAQTNGASIVSRDIANMTLQAVCPKGEEFKIKYYLEDAIRPNIAAYESKIEYTCPEYPEMVPYEDVVPFVPYPEMIPYPEYDDVATDFSTWSSEECEAFIKAKGWDFEGDSGTTFEDAGRTQLRNYCKNNERKEHDAYKIIYEQQYIADKLAYEQQYEIDKQAYIDEYNAKKAEFEAGCAAKITWQEFDDNLNYTTTLENITENKNNAVFYMRTKSTDNNGSCYSGVVTINVTYIDGISNNLIEFVGDEYKGKDSIIVTAGEGNPAIKGELVEGGFGIPKDNADCIYSYTWKYYNEALSTWEKLVDNNGNELMFDEFNTNDGNRAEIRNVSLEADILKNAIAQNPKGLKIARFVSSYKINEMSSKMEYMSNVLVISSSKLIEDDKFTYEKSDKFCPGAGSVNILFTDVELEENEVLDVKVLEKDQEDLEQVFNYEKRFVSIVNPYKDFNVSICRRDTITNVKSNDVVLEIDIPEFKADFMVSVDYIDHELTEDRINVQSGSRVKLINTTVDEIGGTLYNWTLQVQKDGLLAQPSEKESPVCYLYNPGLNQIRLEVMNANKCKSVVTADNIFVTGLPDSRSSSFFAEDEANEQMLATESYIRVFPTILIDENIVNVQSNIERYDVVITDVAGKVMLVAENLTMSSTLDLAFLPNGIYILNASGNAFKLIKK